MWKCVNKAEITPIMLNGEYDSFILSLCNAVGDTVICKQNAYIRYRKHTTNTSGNSDVVMQWEKRIEYIGEERGAEPTIV